MLKRTLYIKDLDDIDPETAKNLQAILDMTGVEDLCLTFMYTTSVFG